MSADKYPCIFSLQMGAIVHVYHSNSKALHSYFIPCRRKADTINAAWHDGKGTMARLDVIPSSIQRLSYILIACIFYICTV